MPHYSSIHERGRREKQEQARGTDGSGRVKGMGGKDEVINEKVINGLNVSL